MDVLFPPPGYLQVPSKIEGIEVFAPTSEQTSAQPGVTEFICPQCGATTAYGAMEGGVKCAHCGYTAPANAESVGHRAEETEFTEAALQQPQVPAEQERRELECQTCGAKTSVPLQALTHTCAFCGSNKVIQHQAVQDLLKPRFVIPFKIEAEKCHGIVRALLGSSWMTPQALKTLADQASFTGMYLPYWTFDSVTAADWKAEVGHTKTERYFSDGEWKERTVIDWRWESGRVSQRFDDFLQPGTSRLSKLLLSKVNDFDMGELKAYKPDFLAGFQALSFDIPLERSWETAREQMRETTRQACRQQASSGHIRNFSMSLDFSQESWRYILLPVYLAGYRYNQVPFQVVINGLSGQFAGQRPVDWTRVWLVIAAILGPGLLLSLVGALTLVFGGLGAIIGGVGFVLLVIGIIAAIVILRQAMGMDDA